MSKKLVLITTLIIILAGMSVVAFRFLMVKASSTIYIRTDGSIDPPDVPILNIDNVTYIFLGNINDSIMVEKSHITIDGVGYTLDGSGSWGTGIIIQYISYNVTIQNVKITGFGIGISIISSWNNTVSRNNITNNANSIFLHAVSNTTFNENNIANNVCGIRLENCSNNKFYHNYFINNTNQVHVETSDVNVWDNGYLLGGNYWSNFKEKYPDVEDIYSGPHQDQPGNDSFWDYPYEIDENNIDNYPIVPEFPSPIILPLFIVVTVLTTVVAEKTRAIILDQ